MTGSAARQTRSTPKKLVSICARASAMGVSSTGPIKAQPALFTTASRRHPHVGNHHGKFSSRKQCARAFAGIGEDGFKTLTAQERVQQTALAGIVVQNQDA